MRPDHVEEHGDGGGRELRRTGRPGPDDGPPRRPFEGRGEPGGEAAQHQGGRPLPDTGRGQRLFAQPLVGGGVRPAGR